MKKSELDLTLLKKVLKTGQITEKKEILPLMNTARK